MRGNPRAVSRKGQAGDTRAHRTTLSVFFSAQPMIHFCSLGPFLLVSKTRLNRCFHSQTELEKEKTRKDGGDSAWIERTRRTEAELDWAKEMADRLDRVNQGLSRENVRLKSQFKSQEDDRKFLIKQLVAIKVLVRRLESNKSWHLPDYDRQQSLSQPRFQAGTPPHILAYPPPHPVLSCSGCLLLPTRCTNTWSRRTYHGTSFPSRDHPLPQKRAEGKPVLTTGEGGGGGVHVRDPAKGNPRPGRHGGGHEDKAHIFVLGAELAGLERRSGQAGRGRGRCKVGGGPGFSAARKMVSWHSCVEGSMGYAAFGGARDTPTVHGALSPV